MSSAVFVSYTSRDKPAAEAVVTELEYAGICCWVAPRDIKPGASWAQAVTDAIDASRCMVIIFSGNSNQSNQVLREVERVVASTGKRLSARTSEYPVRLGSAPRLCRASDVSGLPPGCGL
jgi:hypothetical protein